MTLYFCVLQINHMKRFIEQEAQEKAEEIMIKVNMEIVVGGPIKWHEWHL